MYELNISERGKITLTRGRSASSTLLLATSEHEEAVTFFESMDEEEKLETYLVAFIMNADVFTRLCPHLTSSFVCVFLKIFDLVLPGTLYELLCASTPLPISNMDLICTLNALTPQNIALLASGFKGLRYLNVSDLGGDVEKVNQTYKEIIRILPKLPKLRDVHMSQRRIAIDTNRLLFDTIPKCLLLKVVNISYRSKLPYDKLLGRCHSLAVRQMVLLLAPGRPSLLLLEHVRQLFQLLVEHE